MQASEPAQTSHSWPSLALQTNEDVAPATEEHSISSQRETLLLVLSVPSDTSVADVPSHDTPGIPQVARLISLSHQTSFSSTFLMLSSVLPSFRSIGLVIFGPPCKPRGFSFSLRQCSG